MNIETFYKLRAIKQGEKLYISKLLQKGDIFCYCFAHLMAEIAFTRRKASARKGTKVVTL